MKNKKTKFKNFNVGAGLASSRGITLIALVITIIVMLILASVTINLTLGENGILIKAKEAKEQIEIATIKEQIQIDILTEKLGNNGKITEDKLREILDKYGEVQTDDEGKIIGVKTDKGGYDILLEDIIDNEPIKPTTPTTPEEPVEEKITSISLNTKTLELEEGETETLTITIQPENLENPEVEWTSNDVEVATVNEQGKVTAVSQGTATITVSAKNDDTIKDQCTVTVNEPIPTGPAVTLSNGTKVTLTKDNVYEYLGKKVTNYTGAGSVKLNGSTVSMSTIYRLYYVDFENKYGDGESTIYLKSEGSSYEYTLGTSSRNETIQKLNPGMYQGEVKFSGVSDGLYYVSWLTLPDIWASLKDEKMSSYINYIIGAPSLEMMIDSYNTHYQLTGETPDISEITAGERRKLFYKYPNSENVAGSGYLVGPAKDYGNVKEYGINTLDNSVYLDKEIGYMYYPGDEKHFWLASQSGEGSKYVVMIYGYNGGRVGAHAGGGYTSGTMR